MIPWLVPSQGWLESVSGVDVAVEQCQPVINDWVIAGVHRGLECGPGGRIVALLQCSHIALVLFIAVSHRSVSGKGQGNLTLGIPQGQAGI